MVNSTQDFLCLKGTPNMCYATILGKFATPGLGWLVVHVLASCDLEL